MVNLYSLPGNRTTARGTKTRVFEASYRIYTRIKDKCLEEGVAKFESGALYAEMYLRQNQSRGNGKKEREREEDRVGGGRKQAEAPPNRDRSKDEDGGRFDGRKKSERNRSMRKSIVRLTGKKKNKENVVRWYVYT